VADDVQKTVKAVTGAGKSAEKKDSAKSSSKSGD
jgi:hypothetical protein